MEPTQADLQKAANILAHVKKMHKAHDDFHAAQASFHDGLCKLHKGTADYHDKMAKLHKARGVEASDHFATLHKMLGSEEASSFGAEGPKTIDITALGTENALKVEKVATPDFEGMFAKMEASIVEKVTKMVPKTDDIISTVMGAMLGEEGVRKALSVAKENVTAAVGIGDRTTAPAIKADLKLGHIPVAKADDASTGATNVVKAEPVDMKKIEKGDVEEALKFMKDVKVTNEVPATLSEMFGNLSRGR